MEHPNMLTIPLTFMAADVMVTYGARASAGMGSTK